MKHFEVVARWYLSIVIVDGIVITVRLYGLVIVHSDEQSKRQAGMRCVIVVEPKPQP